MNSCYALLLSVSLAVGQAPANENLKVLEPLIGTWEGVIAMPETPVADNNPLNLKGGQEVAVIATYSWSDNGQSVDLRVVMVVDDVEVPFTNGVITWCAKKKAVIGRDSYASGTYVNYTITRNRNTFHWDLEGVEADGDTMSAEIDATITPDGKHVSQWTNQFSGGKKLADGDEIVLHRTDTTSTREEFDEFCKAWKGVWVSSKTLEEDAPGVGEEGDEVTVYADCDVDNNGHLMICRGQNANGANTWLVAYDAKGQQLKTTWTTSTGLVAHGKLYKRGEKWINMAKGSTGDGTKIKFYHVVTISNQGDTHTWVGKVVTGTEPAVETQQVFHRISTD